MKEETELRLVLNAVTKKVDALIVSKSINAANIFHVDNCSICATSMHLAHNCPSSPAFAEYSIEQVNTFNDYWKWSSGPYSKTYNPGW